MACGTYHPIYMSYDVSEKEVFHGMKFGYVFLFRVVILKDKGRWCNIRGPNLSTIRRTGPRLSIKTVLSTYGDFHVKDKTAVRTSYL